MTSRAPGSSAPVAHYLGAIDSRGSAKRGFRSMTTKNILLSGRIVGESARVGAGDDTGVGMGVVVGSGVGVGMGVAAGSGVAVWFDADA